MSAPTKRKKNKKKRAKKPMFIEELEEWEEPESAPLAHANLGRMLKYINDSNESQEIKEHDKSVMTFLACYAEENNEIIIDNFTFQTIQDVKPLYVNFDKVLEPLDSENNRKDTGK